MSRYFHISPWVLLLTISTIFFSCESSIEYTCSDFKSRVVLESIFSPDSSWHVQVTKSKCRFNPDEEIFIDDVNVQITNISADPQYDLNVDRLDKSQFHVKNKCIPGNLYRILVESIIDGELVRSEAFGRVPAVPETFVDIREIKNDAGVSYFEIDFKLKQSGIEENYYIMNLVDLGEEESDIVIDTLGNGNEGGTQSPNENAIVDFRNGSDGLDLEFIDKDDFTSGEYNGTMYTPVRSNISGPNGSLANKKYAMRVRSVSQDLFEFYKTLDEYDNSNPYAGSISNPLDIHSNVSNGFGIFSGYNQTLHLIKP